MSAVRLSLKFYVEVQHSADKGRRKAYAIVMRTTDTMRQTASRKFSDVDMSFTVFLFNQIVSKKEEDVKKKNRSSQSN
eukprot:snap_masked-scaffold_3-processed-gene-0.13-mRNA-1 protein AED:1.00 eAED:1.00 QI:0/0/0/0/1/1/2/0/77